MTTFTCPLSPINIQQVTMNIWLVPLQVSRISVHYRQSEITFYVFLILCTCICGTCKYKLKGENMTLLKFPFYAISNKKRVVTPRLGHQSANTVRFLTMVARRHARFPHHADILTVPPFYCNSWMMLWSSCLIKTTSG